VPARKSFGQIRPIHGRILVGAHHPQASVEAFAAQHVRRSKSRGATTDDDDRARPAGDASGRSLTIRVGDFLAHEHHVADTIDLPPRDRVQRGRPHRFTGPQAETGVMPRTPHRIADDESVFERAVIVRAVRADRKALLTSPNDDDLVVSNVAGHNGAV
jgi:hypothetical protein